ncbi:MAG: hypothetical protein Q4F05_12950 [bacterium]|nr:hypothetical protein [bacterium]
MRAAVILLIFIIIANHIYKWTRFYYYKPLYIPFGERLNSENVVLVVGETHTVRLININKRVSYSTSDFRVALVLFTGKVYARKVGTAVINVSFEDKQAKCYIRVIDINHRKKEITVGEKEKLRIKGANETVKWKSENKKVVSVNREGIIKGEGIGVAVVVGEVHGKMLRCQVSVKEQSKESSNLKNET